MQKTIRSAAGLLLAAGMPLMGAGTRPSGNPTHPRARHAAPAEPKLAHTAPARKSATAHEHAAKAPSRGTKSSAAAARRSPAPATHSASKYHEPFTVTHAGHGARAATAAGRRHDALLARAGSPASRGIRAHEPHIVAAAAPARGSRERIAPMAPIYIPPVPRAGHISDAAPETAHASRAGIPVRKLVPTLAPTTTDEDTEADAAPLHVPTHDILLSNAPSATPPMAIESALLMRGSHDALVRQNTHAVADGLERIEDDADIRRQVMAQTLVPLPASPQLITDPRLPENRRYTRPWTARFLRDIATSFNTEFAAPVVVTSAVRTAEFQRHLVRVNSNAAPPDGEASSPHLYGGVVDIGKRGMSARQLEWVRNYLRPLIASGKLDVIEEFRQACFHISVYRSYVEADLPRQQLAHNLAAVPQPSVR